MSKTTYYEVKVENVEAKMGSITLTLGVKTGMGTFPHNAIITITDKEFADLEKPTVRDRIKITLEKL